MTCPSIGLNCFGRNNFFLDWSKTYWTGLFTTEFYLFDYRKELGPGKMGMIGVIPSGKIVVT